MTCCTVCGTPVPYTGRGRPREHCSETCRRLLAHLHAADRLMDAYQGNELREVRSRLIGILNRHQRKGPRFPRDENTHPAAGMPSDTPEPTDATTTPESPSEGREGT